MTVDCLELVLLDFGGPGLRVKCASTKPKDASKNRATSTTDMNEQSSRSHSIVTVRTKCLMADFWRHVDRICAFFSGCAMIFSK